MKEEIRITKLVLEEKKAVKLFFWLFNIVFITYDLFSYFIFPKSLNREAGIPQGGLGYWFYLLIFLITPIGIYFLKRGNPYLVKYIFFFGYTLFDFLNSVLIYWGSNKPFANGSLVEIFLVLFSPLFINKKYFFLVSLGTIVKYGLLGLILKDTRVLVAILLVIIISAIAFVLLVRFISYIKAITSVHEELRQKEKLAVIGQMAAAIGHEIRNPLASLKGFTQLQQERYPNTNDFYPIMIQEIDRINSIANDLMYLGKPKSVQFTKVNIEEIIAYTLSITQQQAERQQIIIETIMEGPLPPIDCDDKQLKQVFINLIKNAIEAMPDGGKIRINIKVLEGKRMLTSVQDEGCGIEDEHILNLGEPFYTTKKDGNGLGLMVTNQIISDHNGQFRIESSVGVGTKVNVILPISQK
ncbi:ATP-binding protein [Bacillus sp. EB600]|uniref:ATP-binding protein n=1 Tax=Bacillus sp. EB600 TaxID=2806345 RepID=UPI00210D741C|nr:ATP-binding protein [Bacillus sp. EB600]MCQ6281503.1 GHKL domain-containing protein [Bacillus sp. EB600]